METPSNILSALGLTEAHVIAGVSTSTLVISVGRFLFTEACKAYREMRHEYHATKTTGKHGAPLPGKGKRKP